MMKYKIILVNVKMGKQFKSMILLGMTPQIQMRMNRILVMTTMNIQIPLAMIQISMLELDTPHLMTTMKHTQLMSLLKHVLFQEFHRNKTNYERPEVKKKTDVRREWLVHGSEDYSIQTIPKMMSSTSDHILYKCAMFISKDEVK